MAVRLERDNHPIIPPVFDIPTGPSDTPSASPTDTPSASPTDTPSASPPDTPTATPTDTPSATTNGAQSLSPAAPATQTKKTTGEATISPSLTVKSTTSSILTVKSTTSSILLSNGTSAIFTSGAGISITGTIIPTSFPASSPTASVSSTLTLPLESSTGTAVHNTSERISLVGPLAGAFGALVGICAVFLLYRWRKQQKRRQAHTLHPEPFDATVKGVDRSPEKAAVKRGSLQKIAGELMTPEGPDVQYGNLNTSDLPSPTLVAVPSSQLEETQRELRQLREIVFGLRVANNDNVHAAFDTESVDTAFTPPPEYATERGFSMPIIQNETA